MEALVAIGLAGNILQFVDFTGKVISKSQELQKSADGVLSENLTTKQTSEDLRLLVEKLRSSVRSSDAVLERLCVGCESTAEELVDALTKLEAKGKHSRYQSVRKALKSVLSKDKIHDIEQRVAKFRDELNLHVTIELRSRIDALSVQESASYQQLDESAKATAQVILDALRDGQSVFSQELKAQTDKLSSLHLETQQKVREEVEEARLFVELQHEQTQLEIVGTIESAVVIQEDAIKSSARVTTSKIEEQHEITRQDIVGAFEREHETIKGDVAELRRSLQQLHMEMERRAKELKSIILQIDRTRKEDDRRSLQRKGNSISVILMSLQTLYQELQGWLGNVLESALKLFGPVKFKQCLGIDTNDSFLDSTSSPSNGPEEISLHTFSQSENFDRQIDSSIHAVAIYYACYYEPLFSSSTFLSRSSLLKTNDYLRHLIENEPLPAKIEIDVSTISEHHAVFALAKGSCGKEGSQGFVLFMSVLVSALDALPSSRPADTVSVLSGIFGVVYTKQGPMYMSGTDTRADAALAQSVTTHEHKYRVVDFSSHLFWLEFFLDDTQWANQCDKETVRGKRLVEDIEIWRFLSAVLGLREKIFRFFALEDFTWPKQPASLLEDRAILTCLLFALIRIGNPCQVQEMEDNTSTLPITILENRGIIIINSRVAPKPGLILKALRHIGLPIRFLSADEVITIGMEPFEAHEATTPTQKATQASIRRGWPMSSIEYNTFSRPSLRRPSDIETGIPSSVRSWFTSYW